MSDTTGFRLNIITVAVTVGVAIAAAVIFLTLGGGLPSTGSTYTIKALLPEAGSLASGARVTMAGADVGRVTSVSREGSGALVSMALTSSSVTPLASDSTISLRERTPIGENYISIVAGRSPSTLKSGAVVPMSQADEFVDVDAILSILQGTTGQRARELLQGLGGALNGRGQQLNQTVRGINDTFVPATSVVDTLYHDRYQVSRLVQDLGSLSAAIGQRGADIQQLAQSGETAFSAIATRDSDLRAMLQALPGALAQVRTSSSILGATSNVAAPVVENLAGAMHDLRPAVHDLEPAASEGKSLLAELSLAAPPLTQTVDTLRSASPAVAKALPAVRSVLCQVNPMLVYIKPYIKDFIQFMVGFGSSANSYDALGHLLRVTVLLNRHDLVGAPPAVAAAAQTLLKSGLIGSLTGSTNYDPFPQPNQVGQASSIGTAHIQGMSELAQSGFKYRHVVANCNPKG